MDCFQILLLFLLAGSCSTRGKECCTAQQGVSIGPDDCGCQEADLPGPAMSRMEQDQAAPYPFPPYPVLRE